MERDALKMRGGLPTIFASLKAGQNSDKIFEKIREIGGL
jgi:Ni2+-binding GTPase involved in maturation of urease and hydrogenase